MKLSNAQLRCLKFLKDHSHPFNDPTFHGNVLVSNADLRTMWPQARKVTERTMLSLERKGLVSFVRHCWQETGTGRAYLYAFVRITPAGVDAFLTACDTQPALRSL